MQKRLTIIKPATVGALLVVMLVILAVTNPAKNGWHRLVGLVTDGQTAESTSHIGLRNESIFSQDTALQAYMQKYGPKQTIRELHGLEKKFGSCHQPAHRAGHIGYRLLGDKALIEYGPECQSGYYHGVIEAYFRDHGTKDLANSLESLCPVTQNSFFDHQCVHGIGHGLLAWTDYELPEALKACDQLPRRTDSCWTGVFMENLSAQITKDPTLTSDPVGESGIHTTKYLSNDPLYPCNAVGAAYQNSCYFLQTSRMLQIFGQDFGKIATACSTAPPLHQSSCYASMGRDVGGRLTNDVPGQLKACGQVKNQNYRIQCLNGAVQNSFWDPSGQATARSFCQLLQNPEEKQACYVTIFERANQLITAAEPQQQFCAAVETGYQPQCQIQLTRSLSH